MMGRFLEKIMNYFGYIKNVESKEEKLQKPKRAKREKSVKEEVYDFLKEKDGVCSFKEVYKVVFSRTNPPASSDHVSICLRQLRAEKKIRNVRRGYWEINPRKKTD